MPPPFNINDTSPAASDLISAFPANEQANRALIEEWLTFISDPTTGLVKTSALPTSVVTFATGTTMTFVQTAAPTGWTKDTNHNNKALRIVTGTASSGGSVAFTTAFGPQTPAGTISNTVAGGTVNGHAITTAEMPAHNHALSGNVDEAGNHSHSYQRPDANVTVQSGVGTTVKSSSISSFDTSAVSVHTHTVNQVVMANTGGGAAHSHTFTGSSHGHTFTGTSMNLAVQYVDVIIAAKN